MTVPASGEKKLRVVKAKSAVRRAGASHRLLRKRPSDLTSDYSSLKTKLKSLSTPQITSWDIEAGIDSSGEKALWAWGTVASDDVNQNDLARIRQNVRDTISKAIQESSWVYVRFRDPGQG